MAKKKATSKTAKKKVAKKAAAKRGRPSKFSQIDKAQVEKLARKGWTDAEMADFFGVTEQTWNNWKSAHPEFFEALKDWKAEADELVERSLFERATGYSHPEVKVFCAFGQVTTHEVVRHHPPDTTAAIFWLKNRKKGEWRDKHDHEHGVSDSLADLMREIDGSVGVLDKARERSNG